MKEGTKLFTVRWIVQIGKNVCIGFGFSEVTVIVTFPCAGCRHALFLSHRQDAIVGDHYYWPNYKRSIWYGPHSPDKCILTSTDNFFAPAMKKGCKIFVLVAHTHRLFVMDLNSIHSSIGCCCWAQTSKNHDCDSRWAWILHHPLPSTHAGRSRQINAAVLLLFYLKADQ